MAIYVQTDSLKHEFHLLQIFKGMHFQAMHLIQPTEYVYGYI